MDVVGAKSSNELAGERTDMATVRTLMAADRTLMAWIRTSHRCLVSDLQSTNFFSMCEKVFRTTS
jgi:uncharacterized membrane protein YidH (DUF202 family)